MQPLEPARMTQAKHTTQPDDDEPVLTTEDVACLGMHWADDRNLFDDLFREERRKSFAEDIAKLPKPKPSRKPPKPSHETIIARAKAAGATAVTIHCFSSDAYWADRLPGNVFRLVSWLSLTELPEYDAAIAIAKLSRNDLRDDDYGQHTLDLVNDWLGKYGLALVP
jgi:hypothetical protein